MGEVLDSVQRSRTLDNSNSNCIQIWVEKVGAVGWGAHPCLMDLCGVGSAGEVLRDGGKVSTGLGSASGEVGFAGVLVLEWAGFVDHPLVVNSGGACDSAVPLQGWKIVRGSGLIGELDKGLLGRRWGRRRRALGDDGRSCECQDKQGEQTSRVAFVDVHIFGWNPDSIGKLAELNELFLFCVG